MRKIWYAAGGAAVVIALLVVGFAAWAIPRVPHVVVVGTPMRHDDFLFTVVQIRRSRLPNGTALYRVAVRIQNEAKIVNYEWRDNIAYVRAFDDGGFGHDFYPVTHGEFILPASDERTANLQFLVPRGFSSANLRFWDGIFMGDAFNGAAYGKDIVPLEAYHPPFGT
jgi:hypothetical protein